MSIRLTTLDEVSNIVISILVMQLLKRYGEVRKSVTWNLRILFIFSQILQSIFLFMIARSLNRNSDQRKIKVPKQEGFASDNDEEEEEITYNEYDRREYRRLYKSMAVQVVISVFCHFKWGIVQPFIIQSIGPFKSFFLKPLFLAHIRGVEVLRPFENNLLFQKLQGQAQKKKKKDN